MPFEIVRNDITTMKVDAIVNAANTSLAAGGGVCGAIFRAAGYEALASACRTIGHCACGQAVLTAGFALPATYIIHTPGPIWQGGTQNEPALLRSCYLTSLQLAAEHGCTSIAFPLISSGIYGYPKAEALRIAVEAVTDFLLSHEMQVYLAVFDRSAVVISSRLFADIQSFIDDNYVAEAHVARCMQTEAMYHRLQLEEQEELLEAESSYQAQPDSTGYPRPRSLEDVLGNLGEDFTDMLLRLIDERGLKDSEVYKCANMSRQTFSKLRKHTYHPGKATVLSLAIALRLNLDETKDLLSRAGYALSRSSKSDVIVAYFISERQYDIFQINEALFAFGEKTLCE